MEIKSDEITEVIRQQIRQWAGQLEVAEVGEVLEGEYGGRVSLPVDVVVAERFAEDASHRIAPATDIPEGTMGLDVGPETLQAELVWGRLAPGTQVRKGGPLFPRIEKEEVG